MKPESLAAAVSGLAAYRWRLLVLFSAALLFSGISGVYFVRYLAKPNTGLVVNYPEAVVRDGKVLFAPKTPFSPAAASGLLPYRDQILSVDGKEIRTLRDLIVADAGIRSFHPFSVEVIRDGVDRRLLTVTPAFNLTRPDWLFTLIFCGALGFTAFYLIVHRPAEPAFVLISLAALFYLLFTAVKPFYYENRLSNLLIHFGKLTSWFMFLFALYFPKPRSSRILRLSFLASILAVYAVFTIFRLRYFALWSDTTSELWLSRYRFLGQLGNVSDGIAFGLYALLLVRAYLRTVHGPEKRQIEWILAGFLIAIPPYFFLDQMPIILGEPPGMRISMGNFANLFLAFVPLFFTVGLIKHRVFNLRFFLSRYVVYALLVLLLLGFFTVLYEPAERLFMSNYGVPANMAAFLVTTLLFMLLVPMRFGLSTAVDRLFYRRYYVRGTAYSATLERRNRELQLLIERLTRESQRSLHQRTFAELRDVLRGIAQRVDTPARRITDLLAAARRELEEQPVETWGSAGFDHDRGVRLERAIGGALEEAAEIREFLSKLTAIIGRHAVAPARVSVSRLLAGVRAGVVRKYPQIDVRVFAAPRAKAICHPEEMTHVLSHLVQNAVEAINPPDKQVTLRAVEGDDCVVISVEDTGPGIDLRAQRKVFDPFFSTKRGHDGLGLYFCRLIVERNAGSIEMRRPPKGGTQVVVVLPTGMDDRSGSPN